MPTLKITGIPPYDGDYEADFTSFTMREYQTIKRIAKVRAGELPEALEAGDTDLIVALTAIVLARSGKQVAEDLLWDSPAGRIEVVADEEEDDAVPPPPTSSEPEGSSDAPSEPSGSPSSDAGEGSPETNHQATGSQLSAIGAV